jgi:hypothetical protein
MAGPNLSEDVKPGSSAAHPLAHNAIHDIVNKFDKDAVPANGQVLTWNSAAGLYLPASGAIGSSPADEWTVYVDNPTYGADGTVAGDTAAIIAARDDLLDSRSGSKPSTPVLQFGPRTYRLNTPDALFPAGTGTGSLHGYTIRGVHSNLSVVQFEPAGGSSTLTDMNLITATGTTPHLFGLRIEKIGFDSTNANASFAYLFSDDSSWVQNTALNDVAFGGTWKRIFGLDGSSSANLNSEMTFDLIDTNGATFSDAFLHSGITSPSTNSNQDQFLNYWFRNCKMEQDAGDTLKFERGGMININGGSWLHGDSGGAGGTHIKLVGDYTHNDSVNFLNVIGVRFELRNNASRVIDSQWSGGTILFLGCSDDSHGFNYQINGTGGGATNFDTHIYRPQTSSNTFPQVTYLGGRYMGYHRVVTGGTVPGTGKIIYNACGFKNMTTGGVSLLSTATNQFLRYDNAVPHYRFVDCRNTTDANN